MVCTCETSRRQTHLREGGRCVSTIKRSRFERAELELTSCQLILGPASTLSTTAYGPGWHALATGGNLSRVPPRIEEQSNAQRCDRRLVLTGHDVFRGVLARAEAGRHNIRYPRRSTHSTQAEDREIKAGD